MPSGCGVSDVTTLMRVLIHRLRMYLGAFVYQPENILIIPNVQVRVHGGGCECVRMVFVGLY